MSSLNFAIHKHTEYVKPVTPHLTTALLNTLFNKSRYPMYTLVNKAIDDRKIGAAMYIFSSHNGFSTIKYPKGIKYIIANS